MTPAAQALAQFVFSVLQLLFLTIETFCDVQLYKLSGSMFHKIIALSSSGIK